MNDILKKYCRNYYAIINCEFLDDDLFSKKLIDFYKNAISRVKNDNESLMKISKVDNVLKKYIDDYNFSKKLRNSIDVSTILKSKVDLTDAVLEYAVSFSDKYDEEVELPVVNTKWI